MVKTLQKFIGEALKKTQIQIILLKEFLDKKS